MLAEVEGRLNEEKKLKELYDSAISAQLHDDIQQAIRNLRKVIAINPDYEDAQTRLNKNERFLSWKFSSDPAFMRNLLMEPQIGFSSIATLIDKSSKIKLENLLNLAHDESEKVRLNTAKVACQMKSPMAKTVLHNLIEDRDEQVRAIANKGLLDQQQMDTLIKQLSDSSSWHEAGKRLIELGEESVPQLISSLAEDWPVWQRRRGDSPSDEKYSPNGFEYGLES